MAKPGTNPIVDTLDEGGSPTGTQSVDRAMQLLRLIGAAGKSGAVLASLSEAMALPKPTCRRLLLALVRAGMVEQTHQSNRYWLGPGLFQLAHRASTGHVLSDDVRACARELALLSGETCVLSVRRGHFGVVVDRFDGGLSDDAERARCGAEFPLGVGASPLAMFAAIGQAEAEESLEANDGIIARRFRRASIDRILAARAEAVDRGFALNRGMVFDGTWGLGVALRSRCGGVVGGLSISTRAERLLNVCRQRELGEMLISAAARIAPHLPG